MFKCEICKRSSKYYERPVMFTIETRDREYPERIDIYGEEKNDPGGYGTEIVKEIQIHLGCMPADLQAEDKLRDSYLASMKPKTSFLGNCPVVSRRS